MPILAYILIALAAYLAGSIPTGYLVARARGVDIRSVGSGNIGATNAMRALGKPAGILVLVADALKGFLACLYLPAAIYDGVASQIPGFGRFGATPGEYQVRFYVVAGIFAVLGHNYTCWLKFKGGKGVATTAGVCAVLVPWPLLVGLAVFVLMLLATRYVSVASISAAVALPAAAWILPPDNLAGVVVPSHDLLLRVVMTALGGMVIYRHRGNIQRLMEGNENRFGKKTETETRKLRGG